MSIISVSPRITRVYLDVSPVTCGAGTGLLKAVENYISSFIVKD